MWAVLRHNLKHWVLERKLTKMAADFRVTVGDNTQL